MEKRSTGLLVYIPLVFLLTGAFAYAVIYPAVNAGKTVTVLLTAYMFFPSLAAVLTPRLGLKGMWLAMCIELWVRGGLFLLRLWRRPPGDGRPVPDRSRSRSAHTDDRTDF